MDKERLELLKAKLNLLKGHELDEKNLEVKINLKKVDVSVLMEAYYYLKDDFDFDIVIREGYIIYKIKED